MIQMYNNASDGNGIIMMQHLRRFHTIYSASRVFMTIQSIQTLNKEVEVQMLEGRKAPWKFTTLGKELMRLHVQEDGKSVPVFYLIIPIISGVNTGSVKAFLKSKCEPALNLVNKIKKAPTA
mmetsp:Transcript_30122/g.63003  ORF Transcript_30122/g.63003 Transcript_30122/m.63003 type:complete len:122 (+) Transcript_30122:678-1043(+)